MKKEQADIQTRPNQASWETYLFANALAAGISSGAMINAEMIQSLNESQDKLKAQNDDEEKNRPPKPPSKPNAAVGLGRLALGST